MAQTDKLVYTSPDGRTKIVTVPQQFFDYHMADKVVGEDEDGNDIIESGWTEEECWDYVIQKEKEKEGDTLDDMEQVAESAVWSDRTFRNAWKKVSGGIDVDLPKARDLARDEIRRERPPVFERLDKEWFIAQEQGDDTKAKKVADRKQVVRDATKDTRLDDAGTHDDLKSAMNTIIDEVKSL